MKKVPGSSRAGKGEKKEEEGGSVHSRWSYRRRRLSASWKGRALLPGKEERGKMKRNHEKTEKGGLFTSEGDVDSRKKKEKNAGFGLARERKKERPRQTARHWKGGDVVAVFDDRKREKGKGEGVSLPSAVISKKQLSPELLRMEGLSRLLPERERGRERGDVLAVEQQGQRRREAYPAKEGLPGQGERGGKRNTEDPQ